MNHWLTYTVQQRLLAVTGDSSDWDGDSTDGVIEIPDGTYFLVVFVDAETYLFADNSAAKPTGSNDGAIYGADLTHVIPCRGCSYLHYKGAGGATTVSATAFKAS
jgi:hypothetical protein